MDIELHADNTASINNVSQSDARTIWFALEALKDGYKKSLIPEPGTNIANEDEMFLYYELAKVSRIQFELQENYDIETRTRVQEWFYL